MYRPNAKKSKIKNPFELYETPLWVWEWLFSKHPEYRQGKILDPSCGRGVMLAHLFKHYKCRDLWGIDIDPINLPKWMNDPIISKLHQNRLKIADFLTYNFKNKKFDVICSNPPFSLCLPFIEKSLSLIEDGGKAIYLNRISYLGTQKRSKILETLPLKHIHIITKRPIWILQDKPNNSSDAVEYIFLVFQKGYKGKAHIDWLGSPDLTIPSVTNTKFMFKLNKRLSQ